MKGLPLLFKNNDNADMLYWLGRCSVKALAICRGEFESHICNSLSFFLAPYKISQLFIS